MTKGIPLSKKPPRIIISNFFSAKKDDVDETVSQFVISPNIPNKIASNAPIIAVRTVSIIK